MINETELMLRLGLAALIGGLIGFEREKENQPAGLRTHMVLVVGACLAMVLSINLGAGRWDPARLAAQVLSGIGFLGAGAILRYGVNVRGLTTAATLWTVAVVGLAVGAGYYLAAGVVCVFLLIILELVSQMEQRLIKPMLAIHFSILAVDRPGIEKEVREVLASMSRYIESVQTERRISRKRVKIDAMVRMPRGKTGSELSDNLAKIQGIRVIRFE